ncbi:WD40 repeat domain-containing protein, partial [Kitasatospora sp. NPDC058060]
TLATVNAEGSVRLWDTTTGKPSADLTEHSGVVTAATFGPDGYTLATVGDDGMVQVQFYIAPDTAIRRICTAVARDFTDDEKSRFLPDFPAPACSS